MNALILLLSSLLFLSSFACFVWTRKQIQAFKKSQKLSKSDTLYRELTALNAGSIGLGERFIKLEKQMQDLAARLDEMSNQVQSTSPYAYAIELAQKGYSADSITELCHISQTEAQLLVMMHKQIRAA